MPDDMTTEEQLEYAIRLLRQIHEWAALIGDGEELRVPWPEVMRNLRGMLAREVAAHPWLGQYGSVIELGSARPI